MSSAAWLLIGFAILCGGRVRVRMPPWMVQRPAVVDTATTTSDRAPPYLPGNSTRLRRRDAAASLLVATRLLAAELAAGARSADALASAATVDPHHRLVFEHAALTQRQGGDVAAVLRAEPAVAFVGQAWAVATATGAAPAEVLARAATDCAAQLELRRAVATGLAGARASAAVMAALPLLGIGLGAAMGARPVAILIGSPAGRLCALLGLTFDAAGVAWTQWIAHRAARA